MRVRASDCLKADDMHRQHDVGRNMLLMHHSFCRSHAFSAVLTIFSPSAHRACLRVSTELL